MINHVKIRDITFPLITENASLINAILTAGIIYINKLKKHEENTCVNP